MSDSEIAIQAAILHRLDKIIEALQLGLAAIADQPVPYFCAEQHDEYPEWECQSCRYFRHSTQQPLGQYTKSGTCHRHAPLNVRLRAHHEHRAEYAFPAVFVDDCCALFVPIGDKPEAEAAS